METVKVQEPLAARRDMLKRSISSASHRLGLKMDDLETGVGEMRLKEEKQPRNHRPRRRNRKKKTLVPHPSERLNPKSIAQGAASISILNVAPTQPQIERISKQKSSDLPPDNPAPQKFGNLIAQPPWRPTDGNITGPRTQAGRPVVSLPIGTKNHSHCQPGQGFIPYEPIKLAPQFPKVPPWRIDKYHRFAAYPALQSPFATTVAPPILGRWTGSPRSTARYNLHSLTTAVCKSPPSAEKTGSKPRSRSQSPKLLPVPSPTKAYLSVASRPAMRVQRPQCLLLVLDLNGTLLYRKVGSSSYKSRLFLPQFLNYCLSNHSVLVWSSATPANVSAICAQLFTPVQRAQLLGEWARDTLGLTPAQYVEKSQVYKRLDRVWADETIQREHHWYDTGGRWTQHNTLLLDDTILKASAQPYNLVQMPEFTRSGDKQAGFDVLGQVTSYLEEARIWDNVSSFVKSSKFGAHRGWGWDWTKMRDLRGAPAAEVDQEDGGVKI